MTGNDYEQLQQAGQAQRDAGIDWRLLETILHMQPLVSTLSKAEMAEIRSLERYGYVNRVGYHVLISAKGVNALTIHSIEAKSTLSADTPPDALAAALARIEQLQWDVAAWEVVHSRIGEALMPYRLPEETTVFETVQRLVKENEALKSGGKP